MLFLGILHFSKTNVRKGSPLVGISRRKHIAKLFSDHRQNLKISLTSRTTSECLGRCAPKLRAIFRSLIIAAHTRPHSTLSGSSRTRKLPGPVFLRLLKLRHVHRELPGKFESTSLSLEIISTETGRCCTLGLGPPSPPPVPATTRAN